MYVFTFTLIAFTVITYCIEGYSLGANFPGFHKWAHYLGKFILGCCIEFDCRSLYSDIVGIWHEHNTAIMSTL